MSACVWALRVEELAVFAHACAGQGVHRIRCIARACGVARPGRAAGQSKRQRALRNRHTWDTGSMTYRPGLARPGRSAHSINSHTMPYYG
jgi:hypothetical protein